VTSTSYKTINDPEFSRTLTLSDAYKILYRFIEQYHTRGESSTTDLLTDLSLDPWTDNGSADPAQLEDFLDVANEILGPNQNAT
jgi:hypothetical protein